MLTGLVGIGSFLSIDKSVVIPTYELDFLGFLINTVNQTISVMPKKIEKLHRLVKEFLHGEEKYNCKLLEKIRGVCISWLIVVSNAKLYIRSMNSLVADFYKNCYTTFSEKKIKESGLIEELNFWLSLTGTDLVRKWYEPHHGLIRLPQNLKKRVLYTDASTYKLGGCLLINGKRRYCSYSFTPEEYALPIHVKEMLACKKCIECFKDELSGYRIRLMCDNSSCVAAWEGDGCKDPRLNKLIKEIYELLKEMKSRLILTWVPTEKQLADDPSRLISAHDDSILRPGLRRLLIEFLQPNIDCFADSSNALCTRYISRYNEVTSVWTDAMSYKLTEGDRPYLYPPRSLMVPCLEILVKPASFCCMVVHTHKDHLAQNVSCQEYFDYSIMIGNRGFYTKESRSHCCLTISNKKKRICSEYDGYREYHEPNLSHLLVKGVGYSTVMRLAEEIRAFHDWSISASAMVKKLSRSH